jgi:hypothetical protein
MIEIPRVFVGTLYSGEAELEEHRLAIASQQGVSVYHHIISGLPEKEAHEALWQAWNEVHGQYDLLVKIDADTVLMTNTALLDIFTMLASVPGPTAVQIPLLDYFTNSHIMGLNAFSSEVTFNVQSDPLYSDRVSFSPCHIFHGETVSKLSPIGFHGKCPNRRQSFFFGHHRMKKKQYNTLRKVARAWNVYGDESRAAALLGAIAACSTSKHHVDYSTDNFDSLLSQYTNNPVSFSRLKQLSFLFLLMGEGSFLRRKLSWAIGKFVLSVFFG